MLASFNFAVFILYSLKGTFEKKDNIFSKHLNVTKPKHFTKTKQCSKEFCLFYAPHTHSKYALPFAITFCDLGLHLLLSSVSTCKISVFILLFR